VIRTLALVALLATSCSRKDNNSSDTDQASKDLRSAQTAVTEKSKDLTATEDDVQKKKHDLLDQQAALAAQEKALASEKAQLGSARSGLDEARTAYAKAVTERFAKLDASIATLATQTDAASVDALAGIRARRDLLSARLAAIPVTSESGWTLFTRDIDTTFDAIEHDVGKAKR